MIDFHGLQVQHHGMIRNVVTGLVTLLSRPSLHWLVEFPTIFWLHLGTGMESTSVLEWPEHQKCYTRFFFFSVLSTNYLDMVDNSNMDVMDFLHDVGLENKCPLKNWSNHSTQQTNWWMTGVTGLITFIYVLITECNIIHMAINTTQTPSTHSLQPWFQDYSGMDCFFILTFNCSSWK